jgi:hypothetical protein
VIVQFVGGVTAVQLTSMTLEEAAVAVTVGAEGTAAQVAPGTVRTMVAELTIKPSVPVIRMLVVPAGVLACEVKLTTLVPPGELNDEGAKFAPTPDGRLLALSCTLPVRPPT